MKKVAGAVVALIVVAAGIFVFAMRGGEEATPEGQVRPLGILTLTNAAGDIQDPNGITLSLGREYGGTQEGSATVVDGGFFRFGPVAPGRYSLSSSDGLIDSKEVVIERNSDPLWIKACSDCKGKKVAIGHSDMGHSTTPAAKDAAAPAKESTPEPKPAATASTVIVTSPASGDLKYDMAEYSTSAGKVTIAYTNPSPVPHNVAIDVAGKATEGKVIQGGATDEITVDLTPGTYEIYCSVPGHRQAGMVAKLVVK